MNGVTVFLSTITAHTPLPVTLVIVRIISTTLSIPITKASHSKGKPILTNTRVAIIEAVPGTPAVPIVAIVQVKIISAYCVMDKSILNKLAVGMHTIDGNIAPQPSIFIVAPSGATKLATDSFIPNITNYTIFLLRNKLFL